MPRSLMPQRYARLAALTACAVALAGVTAGAAGAGHGGDHLEVVASQGDVSAVAIPGDGSYVDVRTAVGNPGFGRAAVIDATVPIIYVAGDPAQSCQLSVELWRGSVMLSNTYLVPPNATDVAYGSVHLSYRDASSPSGALTYKIRAAAQSTCAGAAIEGIALLRVTRADLPGWTAHDHDDRYYTETESDGRFCNETGEVAEGCASNAASGVSQEDFDAYVLASHTCGDTEAEPAQPACEVALAGVDRERLDLGWWGVWAIVGLLLVLLVAERWHGSWRVLRE